MPIVDASWPRADEWLGSGSSNPRLAVIGVPTSVGSLTPSEGWRTPGRFREVLARFSTYDGEHDADLEDLPVVDGGDWELAGLDLDESLATVARLASELDRSRTHAFIGGDNAITRPLVGALAGDGLAGTGVLTFDAHHDVRLLDAGPTNGTPIRGLVEDGLPGRQVVQVGIQSFANSAAYRAYCRRTGIGVVTMGEVAARGIEAVVAECLDYLAQRSQWIYVDFDIDVLDRAFAPGCPGSRPGGMTPRQLGAGARLCGAHPAVRAADFVEVDPARDHDDLTVMSLAATFLAFAAGLATRESIDG